VLTQLIPFIGYQRTLNGLRVLDVTCPEKRRNPPDDNAQLADHRRQRGFGHERSTSNERGHRGLLR
jgi:hypothetical protein